MTDKQAIYSEPWPDRWERLTGNRPNVVQRPSRVSPFGVTYSWLVDGEVVSTRTQFKNIMRKKKDEHTNDSSINNSSNP